MQVPHSRELVDNGVVTSCRYESLEEVEVEAEAEHARSMHSMHSMPQSQLLAELKKAVTIEVIAESRKVRHSPSLAPRSQAGCISQVSGGCSATAGDTLSWGG